MAMKIELVADIQGNLPKDDDHPYRTGAWRPNTREYDAFDLEVEGELPEDLLWDLLAQYRKPAPRCNRALPPIRRRWNASFHALRSRENRVPQPLHSDGRLQRGIGGGPTALGGLDGATGEVRARRLGSPHSPQGFLQHRCRRAPRTGRDELLPVRRNLRTRSANPYANSARPPGSIPSHRDGASPPTRKWIKQRRELLFFNYAAQAPYMHYGVVDAEGQLAHYIPVELPGPRLPHDMAFTQNFAILNDLPLFWDPEVLRQGAHAVRFFHEMPSRFAIVPPARPARRNPLVRSGADLRLALDQRLRGGG